MNELAKLCIKQGTGDYMKTLTIRTTDPIYKKLKELSAKDKRSLNNYIVILLEQHISALSDRR